MKSVAFRRAHRAFAWVTAVLPALVLASFAADPAAAASKRPKKDTAAPVVEHTPVATHDGKGPVVITATITDESAIYEPTLVVRMAGAAGAAPGAAGAPFTRVPLVKSAEGDAFSAEVPASLLAGDVEYLVEAFDEHGNGPSRVGDEAAPLTIKRVAPVAPLEGDKPPPPPPPPVAEDNTGLIVGGIVVGSIVIVGAAAGIGVALYALRPPAPEVVRINVAGPAPVATAGAL